MLWMVLLDIGLQACGWQPDSVQSGPGRDLADRYRAAGSLISGRPGADRTGFCSVEELQELGSGQADLPQDRRGAPGSRGGQPEGGHQRGRRDVPGWIVGLIQVQLDGRGQVGQGLVKCVPLTGHVDLQALRHIPGLFPVQRSGLLRGDVPPGDRNVLIKQLAAIHSAVALCDRAASRADCRAADSSVHEQGTNRPPKLSKAQVGRAGLEPATGRL